MGIVLKRFAERVGEQEGMGERWHQAGSGRMDACSLGTTIKERREAKARYGRGGSDTGKG